LLLRELRPRFVVAPGHGAGPGEVLANMARRQWRAALFL
jgi:hypothetical protein